MKQKNKKQITTISVSKETKKRLAQVKLDYDYDSWDKFLAQLLKEFLG